MGSGYTFLRCSKRVLVSVLTQMLFSYLKGFCSFQDLFSMDGQVNSGKVAYFQVKMLSEKEQGRRMAVRGGRKKAKSR